MRTFLLTLALTLAVVMPVAAQFDGDVEQTPVGEGETLADDSGIKVDGLFYDKVHIANKKYIPYAYVREADVLWSKTIWRIIDLREKINLTLYYPTRDMDGRRSLMSVIYDALCNGDIRGYSVETDNEFSVLMDIAAIKARLGASVDTMTQEDPITGEISQVVMESEANVQDVKKLLLKEVWFFDKKYTRMDVRIIGICPILERMNAEGTRLDQILGFWLYFPQLRPYLTTNEVFNTKNDAQRESFDDVFAKRRFGSYVYKEANVYDNRSINEYSAGMETTMEAERIKDEIFRKEHDMWEY